jgi:hypothetical protein
VRLDCAFPRNLKLLALLRERNGHRAAFVYVCSLALCGEQGSDGFLSAEALPHVHGRPADAVLLVKHRFWWEKDGGWLVNGWDERNPSTEETRERRDRYQAASRKANCQRWHGKGCGCWREPAGGMLRSERPPDSDRSVRPEHPADSGSDLRLRSPTDGLTDGRGG